MIDVVDKEDFHVVGKDFVCFLSEKIQEWEDENLTICNQFVFVTHNGRRFDVPFLCKHFERFNILEWEKFLEHFDLYLLDTLELSKFSIKENDEFLPIPENYKLLTLYLYCTREVHDDDTAHRAEADVQATTRVLLYRDFWKHRKMCIHKGSPSGSVVTKQRERDFNISEQVVPNSPNDDSDTDNDDDNSNESSSGSEIEDEESEEDIVDEYTTGWKLTICEDYIVTRPLWDRIVGG
jgi:Exonuclease